MVVVSVRTIIELLFHWFDFKNGFGFFRASYCRNSLRFFIKYSPSGFSNLARGIAVFCNWRVLNHPLSRMTGSLRTKQFTMVFG